MNRKTKDILQLLDEMSDTDLIEALSSCDDWGLDYLFETTRNQIDEYLKIPTIEHVIQEGSGLDLDKVSSDYQFKISRWEGESDNSFRSIVV